MQREKRENQSLEVYIDRASARSTLSLSFRDIENEEITLKKLRKTYVTKHALPRFFSNLLPEGTLKDYIITQYKIHPNDEFTLLKRLGSDIPGNIYLQPAEFATESELQHSSEIPLLGGDDDGDLLRFSLAGIQMKFSMRQQDHRFTISHPGELGDYIVKTPSSIHKNLPETEYSMMLLAQAVGVDIPEVKLVEISDLDHLPPINLPNEKYAYVIKRFDRMGDKRVHIEDFAQVLGFRPHEKYASTNYDTMGRVIFGQSANAHSDLVEFIRRITVNRLLGNTDAHIKNWSLIYHDRINPSLSPAYDIVSSLSYIKDRNNALKMGGIKYFYDLNQQSVDRFISKTKLPANLVNNTIEQTRQAAEKHWPALLRDLPIAKDVLLELKDHFKRLQSPFYLNIKL